LLPRQRPPQEAHRHCPDLLWLKLLACRQHASSVFPSDDHIVRPAVWILPSEGRTGGDMGECFVVDPPELILFYLGGLHGSLLFGGGFCSRSDRETTTVKFSMEENNNPFKFPVSKAAAITSPFGLPMRYPANVFRGEADKGCLTPEADIGALNQ